MTINTAYITEGDPLPLPAHGRIERLERMDFFTLGYFEGIYTRHLLSTPEEDLRRGLYRKILENISQVKQQKGAAA